MPNYRYRPGESRHHWHRRVSQERAAEQRDELTAALPRAELAAAVEPAVEARIYILGDCEAIGTQLRGLGCRLDQRRMMFYTEDPETAARAQLLVSGKSG